MTQPKKGMDPKVAAALGAAAGVAAGLAAGAMTNPKNRAKVKNVAAKLQKEAKVALKKFGQNAAKAGKRVSAEIDKISQ